MTQETASEESYFDWIHEGDWEWRAILIEFMGVGLFLLFGPLLLGIWPLEVLGYVVWVTGFSIWIKVHYDW